MLSEQDPEIAGSTLDDQRLFVQTGPCKKAVLPPWLQKDASTLVKQRRYFAKFVIASTFARKRKKEPV